MTNDRRGGPRVPAPAGTVVRVKFKDKAQFRSCYVKDISRNGIFLRTSTPLPVFEKITVVLELPDGQTIDLHGEVVHAIQPEQAGPGAAAGMGVQFGDLTPAIRERLESYLDRMKSRPPPEGGLDGRTVRPGGGPRPHGIAADLEQLVHGLRRLLWICADATQLASADYYELLGLPPTAAEAEVRSACGVLRILLDPSNAPPGVDSEPARFSALLMMLEEIEDCLTDPRRRAAYDEARSGILR